MLNRKYFKIFTIATLVIIALQIKGYAFIYTIKSNVNLRKGPGLNYQVIQKLNHNQTLKHLGQKGRWKEIETVSGQTGFLRDDMVSDIWIKVYKKERLLFLLKKSKIVKKYKIALCPFNPLGDKVRQGDGGTPEGRFFICEAIRNPKKAKYGARSLRITYPNLEDARRGLKDDLINYGSYIGIVKSIKSGKTPSQGTVLGGSIRIHGGGNSSDWTLGCMALNDSDIIELFDLVSIGTRVDIYKSRDQDSKMNHPDYLKNKILKGAKEQLSEKALYTHKASQLIKLDYPMGDIMSDQAVCTDIIIRSLRNAGIDLQALVHEDLINNPSRYSHLIQKPNFHIDHRRTRNLETYFKNNFMVFPTELTIQNKKLFKPGDIVILDTGIQNGTIYDHIGIIDEIKSPNGYPKVINIWTTGYHTASMDLLGMDYPVLVGHFRPGFMFDYID